MNDSQANNGRRDELVKINTTANLLIKQCLLAI
jgi:hypothetical protein